MFPLGYPSSASSKTNRANGRIAHPCDLAELTFDDTLIPTMFAEKIAEKEVYRALPRSTPRLGNDVADIVVYM